MKKEIIEDLQIYTQVLSKNINSAEVLVNLLNSNITTTSEYLNKLDKYVLELKRSRQK